jgi:hypothetical protein
MADGRWKTANAIFLTGKIRVRQRGQPRSRVGKGRQGVSRQQRGNQARKAEEEGRWKSLRIAMSKQARQSEASKAKQSEAKRGKRGKQGSN